MTMRGNDTGISDLAEVLTENGLDGLGGAIEQLFFCKFDLTSCSNG